MAKRRIIVELDESTFSSLAVLGDPVEVLVGLADSAAHDVRRPTPDERPDEVGQRARHDAEPPRLLRLLQGRAGKDNDLGGERAQLDALIADQREANQQLVAAMFRAHDLLEVAEAAKERALASERAIAEGAELREMFLGIVGHDLKTPLGSIMAGAESLLDADRLDKDDVRTIVGMIRSGQRMHTMIMQLLDLTRARLGGGIPIVRAPTDLGKLCEEVVEEFDLPIQLSLEGDLTGCWDQGRLAEALSNLTGNAVRHAAPDTFVVIIAYASRADVVVEVSNHGESIPAESLSSIFEPFRAASPHAISPRSGLGLGLYIAKQIVRTHAGTLDVSSAAGTTTFTVRLPRVEPGVT